MQAKVQKDFKWVPRPLSQRIPPKILRMILKKEGNQWKSYENFTGERPFFSSCENVSGAQNRTINGYNGDISCTLIDYKYKEGIFWRKKLF